VEGAAVSAAAPVMTERQRMALSVAIAAQNDHARTEAELREAVRVARSLDLPILLLADALGVSRSRIRVLARGDD